MRPGRKLLTLSALFSLTSGALAREPDPELIIYNDDFAPQLLMQCSRDVPAKYDGRWDVTVSDIALAEQVLIEQHPQLLRNAQISVATFNTSYVREYGGFTRGGARYLYGSFGPLSGIGLCDGGPMFFGVEFEMPSARVTHTSYNGET